MGQGPATELTHLSLNQRTSSAMYHLHPILCTLDEGAICIPVTVFFPLGGGGGGGWLCLKKINK